MTNDPIPLLLSGEDSVPDLAPDGENGNPSFATVLKVAKALGVRLHAQVA